MPQAPHVAGSQHPRMHVSYIFHNEWRVGPALHRQEVSHGGRARSDMTDYLC